MRALFALADLPNTADPAPSDLLRDKLSRVCAEAANAARRARSYPHHVTELAHADHVAATVQNASTAYWSYLEAKQRYDRLVPPSFYSLVFQQNADRIGAELGQAEDELRAAAEALS